MSSSILLAEHLRPRCLAIGVDAFWKSRIDDAVADGSPAVEFASTRHEALSRLVSTELPFSHVLLQSPYSPVEVAEFLSLTSGDAGLDTQLLLLGQPAVPKAGQIPMRGACINLPNEQASRLNGLLHRSMSRITTGALATLDPSELLALVAGDALEVRYQPMVDLFNYSPVACEALARLRHPVHGTLSGDQFVPLVERLGLSSVLTEAIGGRMMCDMATPDWDERLVTGINFSLDVMLIDGTLDILEEQREAAGIAVDRVMIELTESRPVEDLPALRQALGRLRRAGYGVALDDVGPKLPHLTELLDLPFTAVKLDKSVIRQLVGNTTPGYLSRLVETCKSRGLLVIAEGAERDADLLRMKAAGADWAQGYLIARPLPLGALPIWRQAWADGMLQTGGAI